MITQAHHLLALPLLVLAFNAAAQVNVSCTTNPTTGASEATLPWRNALGVDRADSICKSALIKQSAPAASAKAPTLPLQNGTAPQSSTAPNSTAAVSANRAAAPALSASRPVAANTIDLFTPPNVGQQNQTVSAQVASATRFSVMNTDVNFRLVLARWSRQEGWVFNPEHWTINKDIPVGGSEAMSLDFKGAVRRLLDSTSMMDTPVKPCFYSNRVLRVVPETEACSRSKE